MEVPCARHTGHFCGGVSSYKQLPGAATGVIGFFQSMTEEHYHNWVTVPLMTTKSKIWQFSKLSVIQGKQKHIFT